MSSKNSQILSSSALRDEFLKNGFVGPINVLEPSECARIMADFRRAPLPAPVDWDKGLAVSSRLIYDLANQHSLTSIIAALLGPDFMLWGASIAERLPGQIHPWHTDIETSNAKATSVTAWIGLEHTRRESSLNLVRGSHHFGVTLQQVAKENGRRRGEATDDDVAEWARERDEQSETIRPEIKDGEALFMAGSLWHGSHNTNAFARTALLLQYATPDTPIRIPDLSALEWPFREIDNPKSPCIMIGGSSNGQLVNRMVSPPPAVSDSLPLLGSITRQLLLPLEQDPVTGWKPYQLFRGSTPNLTAVNCHVSVLSPGQCPHEPHEHVEEEILIMLDGEAELVTVDPSAENRERIVPMRRGSFVYYPAHHLHTIRTPSDRAATYMMFKWEGWPAGNSEPSPTKVVRFEAEFPSALKEGGFEARGIFEQGTGYLGRLHSHCSTLLPGGGYEPHVDEHDVAIVVLEGAIETMGQRVEENGVVFISAGELHGMKNPDSTPARYLVFEFHAARSSALPERGPTSVEKAPKQGSGSVLQTVRRLLGRLTPRSSDR